MGLCQIAKGSRLALGVPRRCKERKIINDGDVKGTAIFL